MDWKQVGIIWSQMVPLETVTITPSIYSMSLLSVPSLMMPAPSVVWKAVMSMFLGPQRVAQIAVIEAKITAIASTTRAVTVRGSEKKLRHATIFDGTARILLQLWEKHTDAVQLHRSYRFTDLSTRKYQGQLQLTTTFDTAVEIIADLDAPDTSCDSLDQL
ncbi:hypothetical protein SRHO_G00099550 [Serrasalmus rhombeus]